VNGNPFWTKKFPFHYLITVVNKQRQATVIMIVSSVLIPYGTIFMKPGFVSGRFLRPAIPKSLLVKLILQMASPKGIHLRILTWLVCTGKGTPFQICLTSQQLKDRFFRTKLRYAGAFCLRSEDPGFTASLFRVDLSEAEPHDPVLFKVRFKPIFPKKDKLKLFNPGEQPFISRLVKQI